MKSASEILTTQTRQQYDQRQQQHFARLTNLIRNAGYNLQDVLEHFPAFIQRRSLPRLLAHYELFKKIRDLPGSIAELGVYRGSGFFTWANLLETFCTGDRTRKVYGFDHFQGLREHDHRHDGDLNPWLDNVLGDLTSEKAIMEELVTLHNDDNLLPGVERCQLIEGDICKSVPEFVKQYPGLRLSLLYFDIGLYKPTFTGLKYLYPLVVNGGIVVFNGFGMSPWEGETKAVETYFKHHLPIMHKFDFSAIPHGYFIKQE
ncbi:MAG: hypothetical protein Tsb005_16930 [Gammaproteobacteria bacterium]